MATIKRKVIGKQTYYYLEHTLKKEGKIQKKEKYLGKQLPKNMDEIKRDFLHEIYKEKWHPLLNKIKDNYSWGKKQLPKSSIEKEMHAFAIKFTYDTQRIEGSKLTLRETADLLERGITPKSRPIHDVKEAEAHKKIFYEMLAYKKTLTLQAILYWHRKLFDMTKPDIAGKIRAYQVAISGSRFMPPYAIEINPLLKEFFSWYNKNKDKFHPVELAALAHLKFVTIHPFADGNGRISRLIMNFILNRYGCPMLDIPYEGRSGYYTALERSQVKRIENIFLQWFIKRYIKENKKYLKKSS